MHLLLSLLSVRMELCFRYIILVEEWVGTGEGLVGLIRTREWDLWPVGARGEPRVHLVQQHLSKWEWEMGGMRFYDAVQGFGMLPCDDAQGARVFFLMCTTDVSVPV